MAGQKNIFKNFLKSNEDTDKIFNRHTEKAEDDSLLNEKNETDKLVQVFSEEIEEEAEKVVTVEEEPNTYEFQEIEAAAKYVDEELSPSIENSADFQTSATIEQLNEQIATILKHVENNEIDESDVSKSLEEIVKVQKEIKTDFEVKLRYDRHKELLIDKLHKELQEYKEDVVKKAMQPLIRDLIMVNDNILKLVENYRSVDGQLDPEAILKQMSFITVDIDDALYRQGIEPYISQEEQVDSLKQKILKTIKVNEKEKEKLIAERVRRGYQWDEKIIRKELVSVYVYDENAETTATNYLEGVEVE